MKPLNVIYCLIPAGSTSDEVKWALVVPDICPREKSFVI